MNKGTNGEQYSPVFYSLLADERLNTTHAVLYGLVYSLTHRGIIDCYAKNETLCKLLSVQERTMSGLLQKLEDCGYIERRFVYSGKKITKRYIRLGSMLSDAYKDDSACSQMHTQHAIESTHSMLSDAELIDKGIDKGIDNYIGEASPPKKETKPKVKRFVPPWLDDVIDYCNLKSYQCDAKAFVDHHSARGWVLSNGKKMVKWQSALSTWERNHIKYEAKNALKQNNVNKRSEYASNIRDYNKAMRDF